jgi:hypothetical protein
MNNPYLLIAWDTYEPCPGTGNWLGCFKTYQEAAEQIELLEDSIHFRYSIRGIKYDGYQIVDLRYWTNR